jgi:hypothetical protein
MLPLSGSTSERRVGDVPGLARRKACLLSDRSRHRVGVPSSCIRICACDGSNGSFHDDRDALLEDGLALSLTSSRALVVKRFTRRMHECFRTAQASWIVESVEHDVVEGSHRALC